MTAPYAAAINGRQLGHCVARDSPAMLSLRLAVWHGRCARRCSLSGPHSIVSRPRDVIPDNMAVLVMFRASQIDLWEKSLPVAIAIIFYAIFVAAVLAG